MSLVILTTIVSAAIDLDAELDPADQAEVDTILEPIVKLYQILRYVVILIATIAVVIAGIMLSLPTVEPSKKKVAKSVIFGAIAGVLLVVFAPNIIGLLV
jgi:hypothetical protein